MDYTDTQLKQALVKMLPTVLIQHRNIYWKGDCVADRIVLDTELLHLCWLVEETLIDRNKKLDYIEILMDEVCKTLWERYHATWQNRVIALAKVKGVEIV